jgi:hypothetical protein
MSKAYATEAILIEKGKFKIYQVTWVDTKGKQRVTDVKGHNMKSALDTVLRQRTADKVKSVPLFVWIAGYLVVMLGFTWSVLYGGVSILGGVLGMGGLISTGLMFVNKYFRYTE